jgi:hypothetical protein
MTTQLKRALFLVSFKSTPIEQLRWRAFSTRGRRVKTLAKLTDQSINHEATLESTPFSNQSNYFLTTLSSASLLGLELTKL